MSGTISDFIDGVVDGSLSDEDVISWLVGVYENGLPQPETIELTRKMMTSGRTIRWEPGETCLVDKHSTGGVGDKVSIVLAPALAACGMKVPMISGRGLGHTGGTLDKLESIPGFRTNLSLEEMQTQIREIGIAMVGQTEELVPADKRLYSLRDVTGTVASVPLITSSIVSKKGAEGISSLVLDVKFGRGAFMKDIVKARELANSLVGTSNGLGISTIAVLSTMDSPIGNSVGNSVEILESVEAMCGRGPDDLEELVCVLGGLLLESEGICEDFTDGASMIQDCLYDGTALEKFRQMITAQGGDSSILETDASLMRGLGLLESGLESTTVQFGKGGWISEIDAMQIAEICLEVGAGRLSKGDSIDHQVGLIIDVQIGDYVEHGDDLGTIYHRGEIESGIAEKLVSSIGITDSKPHFGPRIVEVVK